MRHEDAGLALWLASGTARKLETGCDELLAVAQAAKPATARSLRQRAGAAVIALGERLAGESRPAPRRRLASQGS